MVHIHIKRLPVLVLLALTLCLGGCRGVRDIKVTSLNLESVSLRGLKGIDLFVAVGVDNPARQVGLSDIEGSLVHSGKVIGRVAVAPFILTARSSETYNLKASVSLVQGAGIKELMAIAAPGGLDGCTVSLTAKATYGKRTVVPVRMNDVPLKELLEHIGYEKN